MMKMIFENWPVKILSLFIAVVIWVFITGEQVAEVGFSIPLELKNIPKGLMVVNSIPGVIDVRLSGPRTILSGIRPGELNLTLDLQNARPGMTSFGRLENRIHVSSALKVSRVSPASLDVRLEEVEEKLVPVRVMMNGIPAESYRLADVEVNPKMVMVSGPRNELRKIHEVSTGMVDIAHLEKNLAVKVPLNFDGDHVSLGDVHEVHVRIFLEKLKPELPLENVVPETEEPVAP